MSSDATTTAAPAGEAAQRAAGSSFYAGMRILPPSQRVAMYEIYSFCRAVDDIADEGGPRPQRLADLERWRGDIAAIYAGNEHVYQRGLAEAVRAFDLRQEDFLAVIDGMEMDAREDIRAPDWRTLDLYCDRVACAVGRLSSRIFGLPASDGDALAQHLGRALQLTNILRDLDEDAAMGRLYLPKEALVKAGITATDPAAVLASPSLGKACEPLIIRARAHFTEADRIMADQPKRTVRAPRLMAVAYRSILERLEARGWSAPRERVRPDRLRLIWAVLRSLV